ncbi:MAG: M20 family metallopeptidase [Acidobacteria bacterium]|nr:M20 family metallopeptidase [Acidobacteriota bacterium]
MQILLDYCRAHEASLIETLTTLVDIESPTTDKVAVDRCGAELARRLAALGGRVTRLPLDDAGDIVRAEFGAGAGQVLLLGHLDTVWPVGQLARMPIEMRDGRLHGPGVYDMKAGLALGMLALEGLAATGHVFGRRVVVLATTDEETGSHRSRALLEAEAAKSHAVLVLEPALAGGGVKTARKGVGEFRLDVHGVSAHAGVDPTKGASAIHELARQILALETLRDLDRGISVNVGRIEGGTRSNVVADRASAAIDVRVTTMADAARIERAVTGLTPANPLVRLDVSGGINRPPMERTEGVARLFALAVLVAADLGFTLEEGSTGGGSDGNFTAALGVPTLDGLGAVGDGAHALHEHVEVAWLAPRAALVAGLLARLTGPGD